jgi:hypothetical protein
MIDTMLFLPIYCHNESLTYCCAPQLFVVTLQIYFFQMHFVDSQFIHSISNQNFESPKRFPRVRAQSRDIFWRRNQNFID